MSNTLSEILSLVDEGEWGHRHQVVSLLAHADHPRPITNHDLRTELGRTTSGEIRYSRRVLAWLVEEKILGRWDHRGRRSALWWINPRVKDWEYRPERTRTKTNPEGRNEAIPWTSRHARRLAIVLAADLCERDGRLCEGIPGQRPVACERTVPESALFGVVSALTRRAHIPLNGTHVHTNGEPTPSDLREHTFYVHTNGGPNGRDTMSLTRLPSEDSSSYGNDDEKLPQSRSGGGELARAIRAAGWQLYGAPERAINELESRMGLDQRGAEGDLENLVRWIRLQKGQIRAAPVLVDALLQQASDIIANPPQDGPPGSRGGGLRDFPTDDRREPVPQSFIDDAWEALGRPTPSVE